MIGTQGSIWVGLGWFSLVFSPRTLTEATCHIIAIREPFQMYNKHTQKKERQTTCCKDHNERNKPKKKFSTSLFEE